MQFLAYDPKDYDYTTLDDGLYTRHQVFAQNHPANSLQSHLPRNGERVYGVVVKDHTVIGIQIKLTDAERAAAALAALAAKKDDAPAPEAPPLVPPPEPLPEAAKAVSVPAAHPAKDWAALSTKELNEELRKRGLPIKGTNSEKAAILKG